MHKKKSAQANRALNPTISETLEPYTLKPNTVSCVADTNTIKLGSPNHDNSRESENILESPAEIIHFKPNNSEKIRSKRLVDESEKYNPKETYPLKPKESEVSFRFISLVKSDSDFKKSQVTSKNI